MGISDSNLSTYNLLFTQLDSRAINHTVKGKRRIEIDKITARRQRIYSDIDYGRKKKQTINKCCMSKKFHNIY
jgi:hypothetical protein